MSAQLNSFEIGLLQMLDEKYPDYSWLRDASFKFYISAFLKGNRNLSIDTLHDWIKQLILDGYISTIEAVDLDFADVTLINVRIAQKGRDYLASLPLSAIDTERKEDTLLTEIEKPTRAAYAIMHVYLGKFDSSERITKTNRDTKATVYGLSGLHLYRDYEKYMIESNRLNIHDANKKSAKAHLKHFEHILPLLEKKSKQAFEAAQKDYQILKDKFEDLYPL